VTGIVPDTWAPRLVLITWDRQGSGRLLQDVATNGLGCVLVPLKPCVKPTCTTGHVVNLSVWPYHNGLNALGVPAHRTMVLVLGLIRWGRQLGLCVGG
jgi:hypothetical protein